jgi:hypothetical protein
LIKFFHILLECIHTAIVIICLLIVCLLYPFLILLMWIGLWGRAKSGIYGTYKINGIELSSYNKKLPRLISWQEIKELKKTFSPPFFQFEVLLHSNEVIMIDFIEEDLSIILEELELRNISYIDFKSL